MSEEILYVRSSVGYSNSPSSDVVYLSAVISPDQTPEDVLSPYLNMALTVNRGEGERLFLCTPITITTASLLPFQTNCSGTAARRPASRIWRCSRRRGRTSVLGYDRSPGPLLEYESTVTYRLGSLVVKRPSSDRVVPGSNPGPVIFNNLKRRSTTPKEGEQDEDMVSGFWPPLEPEDTSSVDR